ncbi:hypothetical protein IMSAG049_00650 [Clostridiales bacterium]|nr:hypothetical protein IMSAG049_00650 [Clostridiales bacterium]
MDKQALLKSCDRPDERLLLAKVLDQADLGLRKHIVCFSDFLAPTMEARAYDMLKYVRDLKFISYGGYSDAERKIMAFFPDYYNGEEIVFPIEAIKIFYNEKFSSKLTHRDFLGSILGMGIERSKVGDIAVFAGYAYCFAESSIASYVASNLEKVGNTKVRTEIIAVELAEIPEKQMNIKKFTVSSLRADTVFGVVFGKSRNETQELIRAERASVNWVTIKGSADIIKEGDILSLKGSGRGKLIEVGGNTKKGRLIITAGRYI